MSGTLSIGGLVSGLDVDGIITKLQAAEQTPITNLTAQKTTLQTQYNAWNEINTRVLAIQQSANNLATLKSQAGTAVSVSDSTHMSATTSATATPGTYSFTVDKLSTYNQYVSNSFTDQDTTMVGSGSLTIGSGTSSTTIDTSNLTLTGLSNAINQANVGVSAYIVQENATSYRMVLNAQNQGTAGKIAITNSVTGTNALTLAESQQAQDTTLHFGSGDTAVTVTRSGNTLTDVIPGVTLNLASGIENTNVSLTVSRSYANIEQTINDFATQYNNLIDDISNQQSFDTTSNATGPLFGQYQLNEIKSDMASTIMGTVPNLASTMSSVDEVGITTDTSGKLVVDTSALVSALQSNFDGVMHLFGASGTSTNADIVYQGSSNDTKTSPSTGYAVHIDQAATKAHLTLGTAIPDTLTADESLIINGQTIALTTGMTQMQLLAAINSNTTKTSLVASYTGADGTGTGSYLTFTQQNYGASQHINVVSTLESGGLGIGNKALNETSTGGVAGQDVAGSIDGVAATGSGQVLTVSSGDANGLSVLYSGTATGDQAPIVFTRGIGAMLQTSLSYVTDSSGNQGISLTEANLQKQMDNIDTQVTKENASITADMDRMRTEFNAMEVSLNTLQNQGNQLSSMLGTTSTSTSTPTVSSTSS